MLFQKPVSGLVLLCCLVSISPLLKAQSYRILITNDDGIESPLLAVLKETLETLPGVDVVVSAAPSTAPPPPSEAASPPNTAAPTPNTINAPTATAVRFHPGERPRANRGGGAGF